MHNKVPRDHREGERNPKCVTVCEFNQENKQIHGTLVTNVTNVLANKGVVL